MFASQSRSPEFGLASLLLEAAAIIHRRELGVIDPRDPFVSWESHAKGGAQMVPGSVSRFKRSRAPIRTFELDPESTNSDSDPDDDAGRRATASGSARHKPYRRPASGSRKKPRGPAQHNEVEKRRRAYLSSCYVELHTLVPSICDVKASNVTILQSAAKHIKELDGTADRLMAELNQARQRRQQLLAARGLPAMVPAGPDWGAAAEDDDAAMSSDASVADDDDLEAPLVPDTLSPVEEPAPPSADDERSVTQQSPLKSSDLVKIVAAAAVPGSRRRASRRPLRFT